MKYLEMWQTWMTDSKHTPATAVVDMAFLPTAYKNNDLADTVLLESIDTHTPCSSPFLHMLFIPHVC